MIHYVAVNGEHVFLFLDEIKFISINTSDNMLSAYYIDPNIPMVGAHLMDGEAERLIKELTEVDNEPVP